MRRNVALLALLSACVVTGGCVGESASSTSNPGTEAVTPTPTEHPALTETASVPNYDCPYHLQVDPVDDQNVPDVDRRIRYENLSGERQEEFRDALERGSTEVGTSLPRTWERPTVVEYRGEEYRTVAFVC